jgi:hypothetical protein
MLPRSSVNFYQGFGEECYLHLPDRESRKCLPRTGFRTFLQKSRRHLKIIPSRKATKSKFNAEEPKILCPAIKKNSLPYVLSLEIYAHLELHLSSKPHISTFQKIVIFQMSFINICLPGEWQYRLTGATFAFRLFALCSYNTEVSRWIFSFKDAI